VAEYTFNTIGLVHSPYKEKFAIPRQPGLVNNAKGAIELIDQTNNANLIKGLDKFSHIWLLFIFHETANQGWKPLVRPPRLGGNEKIGVLATRSTFRPNPIGMSVVKLEDIVKRDQSIFINVSGLDLLDKTPVVDIKPYIPYSDALPHAQASYAQFTPERELTVSYHDNALKQLINFERTYPDLKKFISQVLAQDPRPAYKKSKNDDKIYGMKLYQLNIQWKMLSLHQVQVISIEQIIS